MIIKRIILLLTINLIYHSFCYSSTKLTVVTENYPPFNMEENSKIKGISTEIIEELFKREKIEYKIEVFPWARSVKMASEESNTVAYSTTRTPDREKNFKWVGPLVQNDWVLFGKAGSSIKITNLDDAKKYVVGGYNGDATAEYLLSQNFIKGKNLILATNDKQNALKLAEGKIDLWATGSQIGFWFAKQENIGKIVPLFTFKQVDLYAAFNLQTDIALIKKFNATLALMRKDGFIAKIYDKYK
ncbi:ABC transporter substrate-binding protein [Spirobacillus cienkowskii]|uniref:substrate-binding periplasmic protein n=1 Tax=Spirobacillus cienkowskii TaxID=495820 RepID=UPI0030CF733C